MDLENLNILAEHIEECVISNNSSLFKEGWEIFKVYNSDFLYGAKIRKPYDEDDIAINEDGFKYKSLYVNLHNTKDFLFFESRGYDVRSIFQQTDFKYGDRIKVGDKEGTFHRYGQTNDTTIVVFDEGGLSFCSLNNIKHI